MPAPLDLPHTPPMEFTAIIMRIIWRLAPALWLEWAIRRLISWAVVLIEDPFKQAWLDERPRNCHWFGGWLAVIEARIDEFIDLRAHQLLNWRWAPSDVPAHYNAPRVRSFEDCSFRLERLIHRFEDVYRLAHRRAETLLRLRDQTVIDLVPDHRLAEVAPSRAVVVGSSSIFENPTRIRKYDPRIRAPPVPIPDVDFKIAWQALLARSQAFALSVQPGPGRDPERREPGTSATQPVQSY